MVPNVHFDRLLKSPTSRGFAPLEVRKAERIPALIEPSGARRQAGGRGLGGGDDYDRGGVGG